MEDGTLAFSFLLCGLAILALLGVANWVKTHGQHDRHNRTEILIGESRKDAKERHSKTDAMVTLLNGEVSDVSHHMKSMAASQKEIANNLKAVHDDIKKTNMILDIKCRNEKKA